MAKAAAGPTSTVPAEVPAGVWPCVPGTAITYSGSTANAPVEVVELSDLEDVADLITSFIRDFDGEVDA